MIETDDRTPRSLVYTLPNVYFSINIYFFYSTQGYEKVDNGKIIIGMYSRNIFKD